MSEENLSRVLLEDRIEQLFKAYAPRSPICVWDGGNSDLFNEYILFKNAPFKGLFRTERRSEFLLHSLRFGDIRIECKYQQSSGSVDEKFVYMVREARECMPELEIWFVMEGGGWRTEAFQWLKEECAAERRKTIRVLSLVETRAQMKRLLASVAA